MQPAIKKKGGDGMAKKQGGTKLDRAVAREVVREKTAHPPEGRRAGAKRTGKRGVGPKDDDFEEPNVKAGTPTAEHLSEQPAGNVLTLTLTAPDEERDEEGDDEESEGELPAAQIQDGMALMRFVRLKPMVNKKSGARYLGLELSVALTEESAGLFGSAVEDRYAILNDHQLKDLHLNGMETHVLDLKTADGGFDLHTPLVPERVSLAAVQQKGDGEERRVIRLSFVAPVLQDDKLCVWACKTHGELVWVKMAEQQASLARAKR